MNIKEHIEYWINGASDNFDAVYDIYASKRYDWSLYIAHLSLEKLLKALYIQDSEKMITPKLHNLLKLAELSKVNLTDEQKEILSDMNRFQIEARYPEFKQGLNKLATKEFTDAYLEKFKEIYSWLKSQIKSLN